MLKEVSHTGRQVLYDLTCVKLIGVENRRLGEGGEWRREEVLVRGAKFQLGGVSLGTNKEQCIVYIQVDKTVDFFF